MLVKGDGHDRYSRSKFLEFIQPGGSLAEDLLERPLVHYGFVCLDHIIDVASVHIPTVRRLEKDPTPPTGAA
jgi:hypothetical protein